jgi:parvulin-like peptidyl-prolyl isomerase
MRYEKELPAIEKDEQRIQTVAREFLSIATELNLQIIKGDLLQEDYARIIELSKIILDQLEHKNENKVKEAIFMGGKVLDLEVDKYINAYEEAEKQKQEAEKQKQEAEMQKQEAEKQKHIAIINEKIVKQYFIKNRPVSDIATEFNVTEDYVTTVISED